MRFKAPEAYSIESEGAKAENGRRMSPRSHSRDSVRSLEVSVSQKRVDLVGDGACGHDEGM